MPDEIETETAIEPTEKDIAIEKAFDDSIDTTDEHDDVKMAMCLAGASFKNVTKLFNDFMVRSGYAASKDEKTSTLVEAADSFDLSEEEGFNDAVAHIASSLAGANENSAAVMIRAYCKKEDAICWAKPKSAKGQVVGFKKKFYKALIENPFMDEKEAAAFLEAEGSENDIRYGSLFQGIRQLVNRVAAD